jgi:hypothetical protein
MDLVNQLATLDMGQSQHHGDIAPADLEAQEEKVVCKILFSESRRLGKPGELLIK